MTKIQPQNKTKRAQVLSHSRLFFVCRIKRSRRPYWKSRKACKKKPSDLRPTLTTQITSFSDGTEIVIIRRCTRFTCSTPLPALPCPPKRSRHHHRLPRRTKPGSDTLSFDFCCRFQFTTLLATVRVFRFKLPLLVYVCASQNFIDSQCFSIIFSPSFNFFDLLIRQ